MYKHFLRVEIFYKTQPTACEKSARIGTNHALTMTGNSDMW